MNEFKRNSCCSYIIPLNSCFYALAIKSNKCLLNLISFRNLLSVVSQFESLAFIYSNRFSIKIVFNDLRCDSGWLDIIISFLLLFDFITWCFCDRTILADKWRSSRRRFTTSTTSIRCTCQTFTNVQNQLLLFLFLIIKEV